LKFFVNKSIIPLINIYLKGEDGKILLFANHTLLNEFLQIKSELLISSYVTNLCRLGILEIPHGTFLANESIYKPLENSEIAAYMLLFVRLLKHQSLKILTWYSLNSASSGYFY